MGGQVLWHNMEATYVCPMHFDNNVGLFFPLLFNPRPCSVNMQCKDLQPNGQNKCWQCVLPTYGANHGYVETLHFIMLQRHLSFRHSILCCDNAVLKARFRYRNHLVMVRTRSCFGLKYLFWSSQARLEMSQGLLKKQLFFCCPKPGWKLSWSLCKNIQWCHSGFTQTGCISGLQN